MIAKPSSLLPLVLFFGLGCGSSNGSSEGSGEEGGSWQATGGKAGAGGHLAGMGGAGGSEAGAGGSTTAGAGGSEAGAGGSTTAGAGGSEAGAGGSTTAGAGGSEAGAGGSTTAGASGSDAGAGGSTTAGAGGSTTAGAGGSTTAGAGGSEAGAGGSTTAGAGQGGAGAGGGWTGTPFIIVDKITGATSDELIMIAEGVALANTTMATDCFKDFILSAQWTETKGLSQAQIYEKLASGPVTVTVDMFMGSWVQNHVWKTIGYEDEPGIVHMNRYFVDTSTMVASNIIHEAEGHSQGFSHNNVKATSVPYGLNDAFAACSKENP